MTKMPFFKFETNYPITKKYTKMQPQGKLLDVTKNI